MEGLQERCKALQGIIDELSQKVQDYEGKLNNLGHENRGLKEDYEA